MAFVPDTRLINTTSPLTGGGNLQSDLTIAMGQASGAGSGYLSSTDWTTFNSKQAALGYTAQDVANLVTAFSSPTNTQYPSALLVSNTFALYSTTSQLNAGFVPVSRTVNGQALSSNVVLAATDVGLSNVTNDVQTKAGIVPNTVPSAGQILVGNGSAYAPVTMSGAATINSLGVVVITFPNAAVGVLGVTQLSVAPVGVPIAFGQNDPAVQLTTNLVTTLAGADNVHYPSALLVSNQLALKVVLGAAQTPGTYTKVSCDAQGLITATAQATTADIADGVDKRYITDAQRTAVSNLSGINSGDQNLAPFALVTDLAAANASIASLISSLSNYALQTDIAAVNNSINTVASGITTNNEVKLTFTSGVTRSSNTITNDVLTLTQANNTFLRNVSGGVAAPTWGTVSAANLSDGQQGTGKIVMSVSPTITTPAIVGPLPVTVSDAANTANTTIATLSHDLSIGAAGVGMGSSLDLLCQSSTTPDRIQARIQSVWTIATDATRSAKLQLTGVLNGSLNAIPAITCWPSSGVGIGDTVNDPGAFNLNVAGVIIIGGIVPSAGSFLRSAGTGFTGGTIQATDVHNVGLTEHKTSKSTLTDQIVVAETVHMVYTVPLNDLHTGSSFRIRAWGNIDNPVTTVVTFTPNIRWGGASGVLLVTLPILGTATANATRTWNIDAVIVISAIGASGGAFTEIVMQDHTATGTGAITVSETNSGQTATTINTTIANDLVLTWQLSTTTGAPHVRTIGGFIEQLT